MSTHAQTGPVNDSPHQSVPNCPLCGSLRTRSFAHVLGRAYFECDGCRLVHLAADHRLEPRAERERYAAHENSPDHAGYRAFLDRLASPLSQRLAPGAAGLDYGAGPGPTLSLMLEEHGFAMDIYDPFFAPATSVLQRHYDFITCTETIEHFFHPRDEFDSLDRLLRPGGWLALMTEILDDSQPFERWHYPRDPTHVCFYRLDTMRWIAARYHYAIELPHHNVTLLRKPGATSPPSMIALESK